MAFREVRVFEVREVLRLWTVLRLWVRGEGVRATELLARVDRKPVRRYVVAAVVLGGTERVRSAERRGASRD